MLEKKIETIAKLSECSVDQKVCSQMQVTYIRSITKLEEQLKKNNSWFDRKQRNAWHRHRFSYWDWAICRYSSCCLSEMKKDYNYIAALEKAIAEKYGKDAVQDFRSMWTPEKEKDYLSDLKEKYDKRKKQAKMKYLKLGALKFVLTQLRQRKKELALYVKHIHFLARTTYI